MNMMEEKHKPNNYETPEHSSLEGSPEGLVSDYLLACNLSLSKKMFSPWPRRGHSFLQIQPMHWRELELLWQSGFDVSAVSLVDDFLADAPEHLQSSVEVYRLRKPALEHLPFSKKSFDYVGLNLLPPLPFYDGAFNDIGVCNSAILEEDSRELSTLPLYVMLREVLQVASKGVVLQCLNPFSLAGLQRKCVPKSLPKFLQNDSWYAWRDICSTLAMLSPIIAKGNISTASMLLSFSATWKELSALQKVNESIVRFPLGALMQVRLNMVEEPPLTGLALRLNKGLSM